MQFSQRAIINAYTDNACQPNATIHMKSSPTQHFRKQQHTHLVRLQQNFTSFHKKIFRMQFPQHAIINAYTDNARMQAQRNYSHEIKSNSTF
jgi:hypothetical protein